MSAFRGLGERLCGWPKTIECWMSVTFVDERVLMEGLRSLPASLMFAFQSHRLCSKAGLVFICLETTALLATGRNGARTFGGNSGRHIRCPLCEARQIAVRHTLSEGTLVVRNMIRHGCRDWAGKRAETVRLTGREHNN